MSDNEQHLYDEFGNYIGPELDDSDDDSDAESSDASLNRRDDASDVSDHHPGDDDNRMQQDPHGALVPMEDLAAGGQQQNAIVLHEDKEHYQSAEDTYGADVRAVLLDEDAMDLDTPIVEPVTVKTHYTSKPTYSSSSTPGETKPHEWVFTDDYLGVQLSNETTVTRRGVALVGHFHHGKTSLADLLLESVSTSTWGPRACLEVVSGGGPRFLDTLQSEQDRQMSLVSSPITVLLPDTRGKTYCTTLIDCPGHVQFHDETVAILKTVDGAVLVVDCMEGVQMHTDMCIRAAVSEGLPIVLVLSKVDRLIVELKLPPNDAYFKLLQVIDSVNEIIQKVSRGRYPPLSPGRGNVAFCSAQHGWLFTTQSFAHVMNDHCIDLGVSVPDFAKRLWGDSFLDPTRKQFKTMARDCRSLDGSSVKRTFVTFILEPLYKIYTACLGELEPDTNKLLRSVGVLLSKDQLRSSARPLLRAAMSKFLQTSTAGGFCEMLVDNVPHPCAASQGKLARCYSGPNNTDNRVIRAIKACDPRGPLVIHCVKNYAAADGQSFWTFGRIYSGTVRPAETVKVLGEGYSPLDDEDAAIATVGAIAIPRGRSVTHVSLAKAGNWVLLEGVDANISKTATIVSTDLTDEELSDLHIFTPLKFPQAGNESIMKLAIEPLNPSELPKMVEGLRRISKAYPMARTKVEESGEHIVLGTGELYMDCLMHDLRHVYSDIEVKVADPIVAFRETVAETSSIKCFSETANKRNKLTFIAEPMDDGLAEDLEGGKIDLEWEKKKQGSFFQKRYNWDLLSSRSVWAFGDSPTHGTNILLDDTLPSEVNKKTLNMCKSSIVQGFQWATREGPLCEEPVRATKIKILDATLAEKAIYRGGGQIIPTARRTVHSSLLTATPRLMEPVYRLDIQCPGSLIDSIQPVLTRRRGHIVQDRPIPGTMLYCVKGYIPVLDSFGFETDLRTFTQGKAMVFSVFDHWSVVPGDPLDRDIILHPLEPSPQQHLARELMVKTRRRKGLSEDVSVSKFFGEGMKAYLAQQQEASVLAAVQ